MIKSDIERVQLEAMTKALDNSEFTSKLVKDMTLNHLDTHQRVVIEGLLNTFSTGVNHYGDIISSKLEHSTGNSYTVELVNDTNVEGAMVVRASVKNNLN